jgi:hypothetical protein
MRRVLFSLVLAAGLVLGVGPAFACHFGGLNCNTPPESQPFDPKPAVALADDRTSANSDLTYSFTQNQHEQFIVTIKIDFDKAFGIDLDKPNFNEKIANLTLRAIISGAQTTLNGRIFDHNDAAHGHPAAGVYHWLIEIDSATPGMPPSQFDGFVDRNAADKHEHFEFNVPESLRMQAEAVDASVLEVKATFFGKVAAGNFLTNPADPGSYLVTSTFTAWNDPLTPETPPTVVRTVNVPIAARAPTSMDVTPATATLRVGETHTISVAVRDQKSDPIMGASVVFEVTAGPNPGVKCTKITDAQGKTSCSYSGANAGTDTLTVTATNQGASLAKTVQATWYVPGVTTVGLSPATATRAPGETHTVTAAVSDQQGRPMQGVPVSFEVTDGPSAGTTGAGTTDASGMTSFSFTSNAEGTDTIKAAAGASSATATVTWNASHPTPEDNDGDGIRNTQDNCPFVSNRDQADNDGDHFGDVCDSDDDNDSLQDTEETPNGCDPFVKDTDGDGLNDWQEVKGYHTPCKDADADDDGASDGREVLQMGTDPHNPDSDGDGVADGFDNCPRVRNADQKDSDGDGLGDACDGVQICVSTDPARCPKPVGGPTP